MSGYVRGRYISDCYDFFEILNDALQGELWNDPIGRGTIFFGDTYGADKGKEYRRAVYELLSYLRKEEAWIFSKGRTSFIYDKHDPYTAVLKTSPVKDDYTVLYTGNDFYKSLGIRFQPTDKRIQKNIRLDTFVSALHALTGRQTFDASAYAELLVKSVHSTIQMDETERQHTMDLIQKEIFDYLEALIQKAATVEDMLLQKIYAMIYGELDLILVTQKGNHCSLSVFNAGFHMQNKNSRLFTDGRYLGMYRKSKTTAQIRFQGKDIKDTISFNLNINLKNVMSHLSHPYVLIRDDLKGYCPQT